MVKQKLLLLIIGLCLCVGSTIFATLDFDVTVNQYTIPVEEKVEVFKLSMSSTNEADDLDTITLSAAGAFDLSGQAYSIYIYADTVQDGVYTTADTQVASVLNLNTAGEYTFSGLDQDIASDNYIFVVVDLNEDVLGSTSTLTFVSASNEDDEFVFPGETADLTATGIDVAFYDIAPSFVFPGQEDVAVSYFIIQPDGEALNEASLSITIDDSYSQFVNSTSSEDGVIQAEIFQSAKTTVDDFETFVTFNNDSTSSTQVYSMFAANSQWSQSQIILDDDLPEAELADGGAEAFWIVYQIGSDFLVSENTKINVEIASFVGVGASSALTLNAVLNSGDETSLPSYDIPVAGIGVENLENQVNSSNYYGKYSEVNMLSFSLRSFQTATTINQINIINDGNVGFYTQTYTEAGGGQDVWKVEIYQDDGTGLYDSSSDTLVGSKECYYSTAKSTALCSVDKARVTVNIELSAYNADLDDTNEELFFVVYYLGASFTDTSGDSLIAKAAIGDIFVSGNYSVSGITEVVGFQASGVSDESPLSSSTTANVTITEEVNISIVEVTDISTDTLTGTVYAGQQNVDMLYVELEVFESDGIDSGTLTVLDGLNSLIGNGSGIKRLWLYRDQDSSKTYSTGDTFVSNTNVFEDISEATLENISFNSGTNKFILTYDIGQEADGIQSQAKVYSVSSDSAGTSVTLAGTLPYPTDPAKTPVISSALLSSVTLESIVSVSDATDGFNVQFTIDNSSGTSLDIEEIKPKVYLDGISGQDITYQFTSTQTSVNDDTIASGSSSTYTFSIVQSTPYSDGTAILDVYVNYKPTNGTADLVLERYEDDEGSMIQILDKNMTFAIENELAVDDSNGIFPVYIDSINLERGSVTYNFLDGGAAYEDDILIFNFVDASFINQGSISLIRGTDIMTQISSLENTDLESNYYEFDEDADTLKFYVGDETADVLFEAADLFENELDDLSLSYTISNDIELISPLFYPNPYPLGTNELNLSFSVTQPTTVEIFIYNFLGNLVYSEEKYISDVGFVEAFEFADSEGFMVPGIYICRIVAEDSDGSQSIQTTKLAIY